MEIIRSSNLGLEIIFDSALSDKELMRPRFNFWLRFLSDDWIRNGRAEVRADWFWHRVSNANTVTLDRLNRLISRSLRYLACDITFREFNGDSSYDSLHNPVVDGIRELIRRAGHYIESCDSNKEKRERKLRKAFKRLSKLVGYSNENEKAVKEVVSKEKDDLTCPMWV